MEARPFQAPRKQPLAKKMANYGYSWYTQEQLEDYFDQLIGNFFNAINVFRIIHSQPSYSGDYAKTLEQETFTDAKKTNYLEAVKYVANLVWNSEIITAYMHYKLGIFISDITLIPQSTRPSRLTATPTSLEPWSMWTSLTPSCSASTPRAS